MGRLGSLLGRAPVRLGLIAFAAASLAWPTSARPASLPNGFRETVVFSGLAEPTALRFSPDGRVFVAEKSGRVLVYSGLDDRTPSVFADLSTNVYNSWDRGLLGLALDPEFPDKPFVYVLYTYDAAEGGTAPRWGTPSILSDPCPTPPGPLQDGCVASSRLSRLEASGDAMVGSEQVLVAGWCQQFPGHSIGDIQFDADGALYASGGDGASFTFADYGQNGNPCGDPPGGPGGAQSPPTAEGGSVRAQDLRSRSDPTGLNGSIIRVDRATGEAWPTNPLALDADENARRILAHGFRNPYRFVFRPGTNELWIGDVGFAAADEIDRLWAASGSVANFGWPCYEGQSRQDAFDALDLNLCETLYTNPGAVTPPVYSYHREGHIVPDDAGCYDGGAAIAGLAFYEAETYPGRAGTLFVADYARRCIWTMAAGADGAPDPQARAIFATDLAFPVDLKLGPGGDLFYVDFLGGTIRRIRYAKPAAVATADPTAGLDPLTVWFDGTASTDPDPAETLTFAWDFEGDGTYDSSAQAPTHTYRDRGIYSARLRVTNTLGESDEASIVINVGNSPPLASIDLPAGGATWRVGDVIPFAGSAYDPDQGGLPASALSWRLLLHHCPTGCHVHSVQAFAGVAGGSFTAPDHDYPSFLELVLTATDDTGLTDTKTLRLDPQTVELAFASDPAGLDLVVGNERSRSPFAREVIVGSTNTVSAPSPQPFGDYEWSFSAWSDVGARSHEVVAPELPATFIASFMRPGPPPPPPPLPLGPGPPATARTVRCRVPKLIGRPLAQTPSRLSRAHCRLGRVTRVYSRKRKGLVQAQRPRAGALLPNRAKVALVVSRGPKR